MPANKLLTAPREAPLFVEFLVPTVRHDTGAGNLSGLGREPLMEQLGEVRHRIEDLAELAESR